MTDMRTTAQWWADVSNDEWRLIKWLKDQYHGEATAAKRIRQLIELYPDISERDHKLINRIAADEEKHARWIKQLLLDRGIEAEILVKEERYWNTVLEDGCMGTFSQMCAIGYHAEDMRLERITLLAQDTRFTDIAAVFEMIRPDELFHRTAFQVMSSPEDIEFARINHEEGMKALGLVV